MIENNKELLLNRLNYIILLIWAFFLADEYIRNVSSIFIVSNHVYDMLIYFVKLALIFFIGMKMILLRNHFWNYIFPSLVLIILWLINSYMRGDLSQLLFLFIIAFYGIDYLKIAKIYLGVVGSCFLISIIIALVGITGVREAIGGRFGVVRKALGTRNSNSCGAIILLLYSMWLIAYYDQKKRVKYLLIAEVINILLFVIIQSVSFVIIITLGICILILINNGNISVLKRVLLKIISFGPIIVLGFSVGLGILENRYHIFNTNGFFGTLKARIIFVGRAFERYPISLFGIDIPYDDMGLLEVSKGDIFLMDNGWMSILFSDGIVFLLVFLCLLQIPSFIAYRTGKYIISIVILMFSLEMFMESSLQVVIYGPIWVLLFTNYSVYKDRTT